MGCRHPYWFWLLLLSLCAFFRDFESVNPRPQVTGQPALNYYSESIFRDAGVPNDQRQLVSADLGGEKEPGG